MGWLDTLLGTPSALPPDQLAELLGLKRRGGVGSDYVASRNAPPTDPADINAAIPGSEMMPPPAQPQVQGGGIGSDYAASGGVGLLSQPPSSIPLPPPAFSTNLNADYLSGRPSRAGGIGSDYAASAQPSTNDPLSREPVPYKDGVPLPQPRPPGLGDGPSPMSMASGEPTVPNTAAPTSAMAAVPAATPEAPGGGFGDTAKGILGKIFNPANAPLLLAMGGGFAGAPSLGTGMRRGFSAAAPQAALLHKEQLLNQQQNATLNALRKKGIPEEDVIAASLNPDYLKSLLAENFGGWKPITVGEGPFGKNIVMSGPGGKVMPVEEYMRKFGVNAPAGSQVPGSPSAPSNIPEGMIPVPQGTQSGILKQGLRYYNPNEADPQKYLDQFSPEMQAGMKNYLAGKSLPVSNPRLAGLAAEVRKYAPLYAEKAGIDHSEVAINGRRTMENELASTTKPAAVGGQITFGGTTLGHLAKVAKAAVGLGNVGVGIAPASGAINFLKNEGFDANKGPLNQFRTESGHYGEEVTKFYTGAPGALHQRLEFAKNTSPNQAPTAMAGSIRGEVELLPERFQQIYDNIEKQFGKERADKELARARVPEQINEIKEQLAKLDPSGPEAQEKKTYNGKFRPLDPAGRPIGDAPAGAAPVAPPAPALAPGGSTTIGGVTIKRLD